MPDNERYDNQFPAGHGLAGTAPERLFTMGLFAWLAIVEKESDKLSESGQNALALLREDLERLARG